MELPEGISSAQLGSRLAQLRERAGLRQAELARQVTWSPAVLSRIEAGDRPLTADELETLLKAIGSMEAARLGEVVSRRWAVLPTPELDHPDQDLLWRADCLAATLEELADGDDVRPAFARRLSAYLDELERLGGLLLRRDHRLAFIGPIGIGKSTAICRVTGLELDAPDGRPVPVLETGGGGVTLCEVHLREGPGFGVVVEPRTHEDIRIDVFDFVEQLVRIAETPSQDAADDSSPHPGVPAEVERAIRNMAALQIKRSKGADGKIVRTDPAKEIATSFPSVREATVEVLARMELHRRDARDVWWDQTVAATPLEWLKDTFEQINNGRHPDFSLPARIELVVPNVLELDAVRVRIVDTRGIDQLTARSDLDGHLEDPHTVALLCSGFNDAPGQAVQHLLQRAREIGNSQIGTHAAVLVMPRAGEAIAVKDESGQRAESVEDGYELKGEQVASALGAYALDDLPVVFFDAFVDDRVRLRDFVGERVSAVRELFAHRLSDVIENATQALTNREAEEVYAVQQEAARHIASWLVLHAKPPAVGGRLYDSLLNEMARVHANSLRASVRRDGEWYALSYTHQLGLGARRLAVRSLGKLVEQFSDMCRTLAESSPEAAEFLTQADRTMAQAYAELLRKMQLSGSTLYEQDLSSDRELWDDCDSEWGLGGGYRSRVVERNREWFTADVRAALEHEFLDALSREWRNALGRISSLVDE